MGNFIKNLIMRGSGLAGVSAVKPSQGNPFARRWMPEFQPPPFPALNPEPNRGPAPPENAFPSGENALRQEKNSLLQDASFKKYMSGKEMASSESQPVEPLNSEPEFSQLLRRQVSPEPLKPFGTKETMPRAQNENSISEKSIPNQNIHTNQPSAKQEIRNIEINWLQPQPGGSVIVPHEINTTEGHGLKTPTSHSDSPPAKRRETAPSNEQNEKPAATGSEEEPMQPVKIRPRRFNPAKAETGSEGVSKDGLKTFNPQNEMTHLYLRKFLNQNQRIKSRKQEPPQVEISIGTIEIKSEPPAPQTSPPAIAPRGFSEYSLIRRYLSWEKS